MAEYTNDITVLLTEENITVTATAVGPAGGISPGAVLHDYAILAQVATVQGGYTANVNDGNTFQLTLAGNTTLANITGWPGVGTEGKATFYIKQGASPYTFAWPSGIKWMNSASGEVINSSGSWSVFVLTSIDAGSTVFGFHIGSTQ
jgi:hypothetical protein